MTRSSRNRADDADAGFTLLEALIAMMLMGVVLGALATITAQWMPSWNHGMARLQRDEQLALGLERLAADLAAAEFVSIGRDTRVPYFDGAARSVTFVRTALGPNAGSELEFVRVAEMRTDQGPVLVRTRAPFAPLATGDDPRHQPNFANPVVLIRAPYRLVFSYAGPDRLWQETWTRQIRLPAAVKLDIHDNASRRTDSASTAIFLHTAIPQSCIAAKSLDQCLTSLQPQDDRTRT
jgi:general secretion pathway protein J